jgi:pilus assembly protein CpaB
MKKLIVIALIMAFITGLSVYLYADNLEKNFKVKTAPVVVAVIKIPKNTKITLDMITVKQLPKDAINSLSAKSLADVNGHVTLENMEVDEQILTTKINVPGKSDNTLFYTVKEGYRALTIKTDEITGVAGYINKGDFIDIVAIMINQQTGTLASQTIAENIEILETGVRSADKVAGQYSSVTVLVKAEDVLKLNYILAESKYRIVARSVTEKSIIEPATYIP